MNPKIFLKYLGATFIIMMSCIGGIDYLVDPYGLFGSPRIDGFNALKPAAGESARIIKPYQVIRAKPRTLIVGNSRPEMGLDPDHRCWPSDMRPVYSMTIPGSSVYMQIRYAQHALTTNSIRTVLLAVDFLDFLTMPGIEKDPFEWPPAATEFENRLQINAMGRRNHNFFRQSFKDYFSATFSLNALNSSLSTFFVNRVDSNTSTRTELGFNPAKDYLKIIYSEGQYVLFKQKNNQVINQLLGHDWSIYHKGFLWSAELEALRQFIKYAKARKIKLTVFINPYHADYLNSIQQTSQWPLFEEWKRAITKLVNEQEGVELWDFSGFNRYTVEEPPGADNTHTVMQWFWEPAHYRKELGDKMLARMLADQGCAEEDREFGTLLSADNIEQQLARFRSQRDAFITGRPEAVARIRSALPVAKSS
ncbi:MAG: hypothetical protein U1F76_18880 [Candidatus Competibacteraceae bacterium]